MYEVKIIKSGVTSVPDSTPATQHSITYFRRKPTTLTDYTHYSKLYIILNSDIYNLYFILYYHPTEISNR